VSSNPLNEVRYPKRSQFGLAAAIAAGVFVGIVAAVGAIYAWFFTIPQTMEKANQAVKDAYNAPINAKIRELQKRADDPNIKTPDLIKTSDEIDELLRQRKR
jgi:hypothetical protein